MQEFKTVGEKIMKRTPYGTRVEGVDVVLTIGNKTARMDYNVALDLSLMLRNAGKQAKAAAGDQSREFRVYANLTDGNLDELQMERSRDGTAVFKRR